MTDAQLWALVPMIALAFVLLLALLFYRTFVRLFGVVIVPEDSVGVVNKKIRGGRAEPDTARRRDLRQQFTHQCAAREYDSRESHQAQSISGPACQRCGTQFRTMVHGRRFLFDQLRLTFVSPSSITMSASPSATAARTERPSDDQETRRAMNVARSPKSVA